VFHASPVGDAVHIATATAIVVTVSDARVAVVPDLADSTILVTGGAGFIGSHVVEQLLERPVAAIVVIDDFVRGTARNLETAARDPRVRVVEGSVTDIELIRSLMNDCEYAFHLAALWLHECVHEPRKALDVNVGGTYNVAEAARNTGVRKVVYSSSASVYGDAVAIPMTEEHPFNNRTMYGATKIAGEQFFRAFHEQSGLDWVGLRYMNVYGPRMDYLGAYVSVIMKVLDRIDAGERPVIFGDGSQTYDFVHVADVARANVFALESDATDELFNVGMGVKTTINELVSLLLEITGSDLEPEYRPEEQMFVTHRVGSTAKAERLLRFEAAIPLEEGLRSVVEWRRQDQRASAPR
jgi:nucleoside-diphosphate-sugar epimerase